MKSIIIWDDGSVTCDDPLSDQEKLAVGNCLFEQQKTDNEGQVLFYTGIVDEN